MTCLYGVGLKKSPLAPGSRPGAGQPKWSEEEEEQDGEAEWDGLLYHKGESRRPGCLAEAAEV